MLIESEFRRICALATLELRCIETILAGNRLELHEWKFKLEMFLH